MPCCRLLVSMLGFCIVDYAHCFKISVPWWLSMLLWLAFHSESFVFRHVHCGASIDTSHEIYKFAPLCVRTNNIGWRKCGNIMPFYIWLMVLHIWVTRGSLASHLHLRFGDRPCMWGRNGGPVSWACGGILSRQSGAADVLWWAKKKIRASHFYNIIFVR